MNNEVLFFYKMFVVYFWLVEVALFFVDNIINNYKLGLVV